MTNKETLEKARQIVADYKELVRNGGYTIHNCSSNPAVLLEHIDKLIVLDAPLDYRIPDDFKLVLGSEIRGRYKDRNTTTNYKFKPNKYYIQWSNGNIGPYQFCYDTMYSIALPHYQAFKERLRSYNPVDEDPLNDYMAFTVEDGKRLMADYKQLCDETKAIIEKAIKAELLKRKQAEIEKLKSELDA